MGVFHGCESGNLLIGRSQLPSRVRVGNVPRVNDCRGIARHISRRDWLETTLSSFFTSFFHLVLEFFRYNGKAPAIDAACRQIVRSDGRSIARDSPVFELESNFQTSPRLRSVVLLEIARDRAANGSMGMFSVHRITAFITIPRSPHKPLSYNYD